MSKKIFISYSRGNSEHQEWIVCFTMFVLHEEIIVILEQIKRNETPRKLQNLRLVNFVETNKLLKTKIYMLFKRKHTPIDARIKHTHKI